MGNEQPTKGDKKRERGEGAQSERKEEEEEEEDQVYLGTLNAPTMISSSKNITDADNTNYFTSLYGLSRSEHGYIIQQPDVSPSPSLSSFHESTIEDRQKNNKNIYNKDSSLVALLDSHQHHRRLWPLRVPATPHLPALPSPIPAHSDGDPVVPAVDEPAIDVTTGRIEVVIAIFVLFLGVLLAAAFARRSRAGDRTRKKSLRSLTGSATTTVIDYDDVLGTGSHGTVVYGGKYGKRPVAVKRCVFLLFCFFFVFSFFFFELSLVLCSWSSSIILINIPCIFVINTLSFFFPFNSHETECSSTTTLLPSVKFHC